MKQALDAAWQASVQARSMDNRRGELNAKERAASGWISGEPVVTIAHRTDLIDKNQGLREYEAEIELPLWTASVRRATLAEVTAQKSGFDDQAALAKLKLAGELRALSANAATAEIEKGLAQRKRLDADALVKDLERRVKAGENARVDLLQAQVLTQQAQVAWVQADSQLVRLHQQWRGLTGLADIAPLDDVLTEQYASQEQQTSALQSHPAQRFAQTQIKNAQAKLALAEADKRDPLSLGVGIARERAAFGVAAETTARIALRVPLGGDNRNAARNAAARAELDAAQAEADTVARQLPTELAVAQADLRAARQTETAANERARLSSEVQALFTKSWRLGDSDLPTRLRADNEQFEANLALARAKLEVRRALSNLKQALGFLP
jgi:outer membrane protein, heavy metal efflux system